MKERQAFYYENAKIMSEHLLPTSEEPSDEKGSKKSRKGKEAAAPTGLAIRAGGEAAPEPDKRRSDLARFLANRNVVRGPRLEHDDRKADASAPEPENAKGKKADEAAERPEKDTEAGRETAEKSEPKAAVSHEAGADNTVGESSAEDPELTQIEGDEQPVVAHELIGPRREAAEAELQAAMPGSTAALAAEKANDFLGKVDELTSAGVPIEDATAEAFLDTTGEPAPEISEADNEAASAEEDPGSAPDAPAPPSEALDFPTAPNVDEDDPYAAAYAAGNAGGGAGGWGGGAPGNGMPGFAGGNGNGAGRPFGAQAAAGRWNRQTIPQPRVEVSGVASGLLVGGIVGYLLGRRRGRIKTEKRLLPVQHQLEKRVQALHDHLAIREAQVRKLVWERAAEQSAPAVAAEAVRAAAPATERATANREAPLKAETVAPRPEQTKAKDLPLKQVLEISETIVVGSTTIRRVFETNLIEEAGLRRIVEQHLSGGDVRQVLTEELMIKELSFERDPLMNSRQTEEEAPQATAGAVSATSSGVNPLPQQTPTASYSGFGPTVPPQPNQQRTISPVLILANIAALAVLAILLSVLLIVWLTR